MVHQEAHFAVAKHRGVAPVDGGHKDRGAVDDGALVVQFVHVVSGGHDHGGDVVSLRGVPLFVEQVHDVLHVVVEVGAIEGHAEADAAFSGIVHRGEEGVVAPAPGPVHLKVLE